MSLPSKSPRSSRAGSLTNLFGLGTSRNQEIELAHCGGGAVFLGPLLLYIPCENSQFKVLNICVKPYTLFITLRKPWV